MIFKNLSLGVALLSLSLAPVSAVASTAAATSQIGPNFQYGSAAFNEVAAASYKLVGLDGTFSDWLTAAYQKSGVTIGTGTLDADLDARAAALKAATGDAKVKLERDTASWAHKFIKKSVPRFSLDTGFELANLAKLGERQCLGQTFVIAALLQRVGMKAGAVMVWANPQGQQSNLGHVVSLVRLSSGRDILVDASDPTPFVHHQGLLIGNAGHYSFVKPTYEADDTISGYTVDGSGARLSVAQTTPLSLSYLHSQFDYYRGERAIGGFLGTGTGKATPDGLKTSAMYLKRAIAEDPQNALATFVLGHVLARQGQPALAKAQYQKANALYLAQGHVPGGVGTAITAINKTLGGKS